MKQIDPSKFKGFRISVSGLREFIHCQWKYALSNVVGIERKTKGSGLAFGDAFHRGAEPIWIGKDHIFEHTWKEFEKNDNILYRKNESWKLLHAKGLLMMDALAKAIRGKIGRAPHVELSDPVPVGDYLVTRRLDYAGEVINLPAIIDGKEMKLNGDVILDLKSAARRYQVLDGKVSMQLRGYMLPLISEPQIKPKYAAFLVVTKTIKPQVQIIGTRVTPRAIADFEHNVKIAAAQVKLGKFSKNQGSHCTWCDFYEICYPRPGWRKLYKKREKKILPKDPKE